MWAATPELSAAALDDFGGIAEVVEVYKAAPSSEARANLFSVLFDHAIRQRGEVRIRRCAAQPG